MKKKNIITIFISLLVLIAVGSIFLRNKKNNSSSNSSENVLETKVKATKIRTHNLNNKVVPTLFYHGAGSSYHAEEHMANAALRAGAADQIIRANVSENSSVKFIGKIRKSAKHPIVEVNYANNMSVNPNDVKNVLIALQNKYGYHRVNLVGHSMGNLLIANYINDNYANKRLPQIQKVVSIAGHYNGWLGEEDAATSPLKNTRTGEPREKSASFRELLGLRKHYPRQIRVLNIYGDLMDGSKSDGSVSVASARSYKYLINNRAKSYQEAEIRGRMAQHSRLHRNSQVDQLLINFLWR